MALQNSPKKVLILIPTYNERENIESLLQEIFRLSLPAELSVLVVDDNSPDGTGELARRLAEREPRLRVLIRTKRRGRGAAGIDGFREALRWGADYIIEMDGDFSHQPRFIPALLDSARQFDVVIGSRFVPGGQDRERSLLRRFITFLVRSFIRRYFRLPFRDVSSGFRCFRARVLEAADLDELISVGPSLVLEILLKAWRLGFRITEVPIIFADRKKGQTKLSLTTLLETLLMAIRFKRIYGSSRPEPDR
ncbi:MAG: polyprenol monophosphomannose synthase [Candidatus Aminicenantales bacterium]